MPIRLYTFGCSRKGAMRGRSDRVRAICAFVTLLFTALVAACAHPTGTADASAVSIKAMTFNVRVDVAADGKNAWPNRKALVKALIHHEAPDILGLQEVLLHQKRDLEEALPDYAVIGAGRDDGKQSGEFAPLAYRSDRFELVDSGTFWLSPTPDVPGKGWDAALPRVATWAMLRERASGRLLRTLNTHFDHAGAKARTKSAELVGQWSAGAEQAGMPTIVMGDFNAVPGSEPYRHLINTAATRLSDSRSISQTPPYGPPGTFTGFRIERDAPEPIDYIFVTPEFAVERHAVITQHWDGRLASDHYPVTALLRLEDR